MDRHLSQWIAMEHYRLHCVERWPESERRNAVLAAIRFSLSQLSKIHPSKSEDSNPCLICASERAA
jgi:hypothetical protein